MILGTLNFVDCCEAATRLGAISSGKRKTIIMCGRARLFGNQNPIEVRVASDDRVKTEAFEEFLRFLFFAMVNTWAIDRWVSLQGAQMEKFEAGPGQSS